MGSVIAPAPGDGPSIVCTDFRHVFFFSIYLVQKNNNNKTKPTSISLVPMKVDVWVVARERSRGLSAGLGGPLPLPGTPLPKLLTERVFPLSQRQQDQRKLEYKFVRNTPSVLGPGQGQWGPWDPHNTGAQDEKVQRDQGPL